jgi:hypothetical protein
MRRQQAARRLDEHVDDLAPRPRIFLQPGREGVALHELHCDVNVTVVGGTDVVDRHDIGVRELRDRLRLPAEPRPRVLARHREARAQQLECNLAVELWIVGGEHHAHAAGADRRQHEVAPDAIADRQRLGRKLGGHRRRQRLVAKRDRVRVIGHVDGERGDERAAVAAAREVTLDPANGKRRQRPGDELARSVVVEMLHPFQRSKCARSTS